MPSSRGGPGCVLKLIAYCSDNIIWLVWRQSNGPDQDIALHKPHNPQSGQRAESRFLLSIRYLQPDFPERQLMLAINTFVIKP